VVWHFAHRAKGDCEMEGESLRHMTIKDLAARRWGADLEVKLGQRRDDEDDGRRLSRAWSLKYPDLYLHIGRDAFAAALAVRTPAAEVAPRTSGRLEAYKVGGAIRIAPDAVQSLLAASKIKPPAQKPVVVKPRRSPRTFKSL
jgi:hypothetical protein